MMHARLVTDIPRRPRWLPALLPALLAAFVAGCSTGDASAAGDVDRRSTVAGAVDATADARADSWSLYDLGGDWRDASGKAMPLDALAGDVRVVAMVYTSCHATCPLIVQDLKRIEAAIPEQQRARVGFVLVSLDPERDTPGRLAEWGASVQLDPAAWTLLAGTDHSVRALAAALGVRYQGLQGGDIAHSNVVTVLDTRGRIVHQRLTLEEPTDRTTAEIARLLR